jgi:isopenicillin-N N-acyltransferase like protein
LKKKVAVLMSFAVGLLFSAHVYACTLFSAIGENWVEGGGSLIAKNRDEHPSVQQLKLFTPKDGYRYFGLYIPNDKWGSLRGGINEKGLVVVYSAASSLTKEASNEAFEHQCKGKFGVNDENIISTCATVDEALQQDKSAWAGPRNIMLADKNKIACVEIGPDGSISVKETVNGTLHHTNHYVYNDMVWANGKNLPGSVTRYERIGQLLAETPHPFSMEDFIAFCHDKNAGPDDSIWRDGLGDASSAQTLSAMVFYLPKNGPASVYVKMRINPEDKGKEKVFRYTLDEIFK